MFTLRPARETDRAALYRICLETGASGQDATHLYADPLILGHVYAGPYLTYAPEFAFVLEQAGERSRGMSWASPTRRPSRRLWTASGGRPCGNCTPIQRAFPTPSARPTSGSRT